MNQGNWKTVPPDQPYIVTFFFLARKRYDEVEDIMTGYTAGFEHLLKLGNRKEFKLGIYCWCGFFVCVCGCFKEYAEFQYRRRHRQRRRGDMSSLRSNTPDPDDLSDSILGTAVDALYSPSTASVKLYTIYNNAYTLYINLNYIDPVILPNFLTHWFVIRVLGQTLEYCNCSN